MVKIVCSVCVFYEDYVVNFVSMFFDFGLCCVNLLVI